MNFIHVQLTPNGGGVRINADLIRSYQEYKSHKTHTSIQFVNGGTMNVVNSVQELDEALATLKVRCEYYLEAEAEDKKKWEKVNAYFRNSRENP